MGYGRLRAPTPPVRNGGEAGKKGRRGNHNSLFSQQARTLAGSAATQERHLRQQTPLGLGGSPPFPMDAARGGGSGCAGGALTLQLCQMAPNFARFPRQSCCRRAVRRGWHRAGMALECGARSAAGMDGHPAGCPRRTHGHPCAPCPAVTRHSPAGCPGEEEGGDGPAPPFPSFIPPRFPGGLRSLKWTQRGGSPGVCPGHVPLSPQPGGRSHRGPSPASPSSLSSSRPLSVLGVSVTGSSSGEGYG